jgi:hypothetical protein
VDDLRHELFVTAPDRVQQGLEEFLIASAFPRAWGVVWGIQVRREIV